MVQLWVYRRVRLEPKSNALRDRRVRPPVRSRLLALHRRERTHRKETRNQGLASPAPPRSSHWPQCSTLRWRTSVSGEPHPPIPVILLLLGAKGRVSLESRRPDVPLLRPVRYSVAQRIVTRQWIRGDVLVIAHSSLPFVERQGMAMAAVGPHDYRLICFSTPQRRRQRRGRFWEVRLIGLSAKGEWFIPSSAAQEWLELSAGLKRNCYEMNRPTLVAMSSGWQQRGGHGTVPPLTSLTTLIERWRCRPFLRWSWVSGRVGGRVG
jgi:hypothetical protein